MEVAATLSWTLKAAEKEEKPDSSPSPPLPPSRFPPKGHSVQRCSRPSSLQAPTPSHQQQTPPLRCRSSLSLHPCTIQPTPPPPRLLLQTVCDCSLSTRHYEHQTYEHSISQVTVFHVLYFKKKQTFCSCMGGGEGSGGGTGSVCMEAVCQGRCSGCYGFLPAFY